jgi:hypothetical protein
VRDKHTKKTSRKYFKIKLGRNEKSEEYDKLKNAFNDLLKMWG